MQSIPVHLLPSAITQHHSALCLSALVSMPLLLEKLFHHSMSLVQRQQTNIHSHTHLLSVCLTEVILRVMTWVGRGEDSFSLCTDIGYLTHNVSFLL